MNAFRKSLSYSPSLNSSDAETSLPVGRQVQHDYILIYALISFRRHPELVSGSVRNNPYCGLTHMSYVYIMSNIKRTTLYIGVTNNLIQRVWDHKQGNGSAFTKKYNLIILLYAEECGCISDAIEREKQLKRWHKEWKWNLIKSLNPELVDLYPSLRA